MFDTFYALNHTGMFYKIDWMALAKKRFHQPLLHLCIYIYIYIYNYSVNRLKQSLTHLTVLFYIYIYIYICCKYAKHIHI